MEGGMCLLLSFVHMPLRYTTVAGSAHAVFSVFQYRKFAVNTSAELGGTVKARPTVVVKQARVARLPRSALTVHGAPWKSAWVRCQHQCGTWGSGESLAKCCEASACGALATLCSDCAWCPMEECLGTAIAL